MSKEVGIQFTSHATAAIISIGIGFQPDYVELYQDAQGVNPNKRIWFNTSRLSQAHAGADDTILMTGSTGVYTLDTSSIVVYAGGETVTAADVIAERYRKRDGSLYAAGDITEAGITIPAGDQTNNGKNVGFARLWDV